MLEAFALGAGLLLPPDHAANVTWSGPAGCPSTDEVVAAIVELSPEVGAGGLAARAEVERIDDGTLQLRALIETESGITEREVDAADCRDLADTFAVFVATAASPPEVDVGKPTIDELEPKPPPRVTTPPRRTGVPRPGGVLQIAPFMELGVAPGVSGGPWLAGGVAWPRLRVLVGASYTAPRFIEYGGPDSGIAVQLVSSHVQICPARPHRRGELWVCGQVDAGAVLGRGRGVERPRTVSGAWVAGGVAPGGSLRLRGPVALFAEFAGVVAMTRAAFELDDSEGLFRAGAVGARFLLGVELRFGEKKTGNGPTPATSASRSAQ